METHHLAVEQTRLAETAGVSRDPHSFARCSRMWDEGQGQNPQNNPKTEQECTEQALHERSRPSPAPFHRFSTNCVPNLLEPCRYLPYTPGWGSSKQGVITVIWGRTESGQGEGAETEPKPLQTTLGTQDGASPAAYSVPQSYQALEHQAAVQESHLGRRKYPRTWGSPAGVRDV